MTTSALTENTPDKLLAEWNNTRTLYPQDKSIHQIFESQVAQTPDAVALVFENEQLTYHELNQRANQLAHYLQSLGVTAETLVGVSMVRSFEMVISLYAILKAGGAYVPLDPTYPPDRLAYMLDDAKTSILLTQKHLLPHLPVASHVQVICLDSDWSNIATFSTDTPPCPATLDNLAYMIYTSGSTGKPKGAMNEHRGILNRLLWMQEAYRLTPADAVLQKTPFSFDVSVWEFFWTLMMGARLVIAKPEGHKDPTYLVSLILSQNVTTLHFVPSMLHIFLDEANVSLCNNTLKRVICSGEALPLDLTERYFQKLQVPLYNLYGPTEAAVDVTHYTCQPNSELRVVPIGKPIANIQMHILDANLQPMPLGEAGELYIGGIGVGRGYLNRPELTQERFIPDPFPHSPEELALFGTTPPRLYKTGDLARYLPDGNIDYLGRLDFQVKLRGFRIELGEIEAALVQHEQVKLAVVTAREDTPGDKRLVAYLVLHAPPAPSVTEWWDFLQEKLPDYMIPSAFVVLDELPLSPNGKIDRNALPAPIINPTRTIVAPRTLLEEKLVTIWRELFALEQISIDDKFLALGGHSILATRLITRYKEQLHVDLPIIAIFEHESIAELAQHIEANGGAKAAVEATLEEREEFEL